MTPAQLARLMTKEMGEKLEELAKNYYGLTPRQTLQCLIDEAWREYKPKEYSTAGFDRQ